MRTNSLVNHRAGAGRGRAALLAAGPRTGTAKLRAAVAPLTCLPIEQLESRQYLSVTTDVNGWTLVTPSADSRLIYVSATGSDTLNTGLSPTSPLKTVAKGLTMLRSGKPDELLLNRGDTFVANLFMSGGGRSADEPMLFSYYGDPTLARPVIDARTSIGLNIGNPANNLDIIGIDFTTTTHDPTSANFTNQGSLGFQDLGATQNLLVEDCRFRNFAQGMTIQASPGTSFGGAINNVTVRRCQIVDNYSTTGNAQGLYAESVNGLNLYENLFDHNGWSSLVPNAGATQFSQDCYLHSSNSNVVAIGNIFANAASTGLQARAGGIVDYNLFIQDPTGLSFGLVNGATTKAGGVTGEVIGNVFLKSAAIGTSPVGVGALLGNLKPGGNVRMANNIFAEDTQNANPAIEFQPGVGVSNTAQEVGLNTLTVENNIVRSWQSALSVSNLYVAGSTGANALNGLVVRNNDFQNMLSTKIVSQGALYDPRYETWSGNRYSTSSPQSGWFSLQGTTIGYNSWLTRIEPTATATAVPYVDGTRDIESYMTSMGMTATINAYLAAARTFYKGNWDTRFMAANVDSYIAAGYAVDTQAPAVSLAPPTSITTDTNPTQTFSVTYSDNYAVDTSAASLNNANLLVSGPGGFSSTATLITVSGGNGPLVTATYQLTAPGNTWTNVPTGTYVVSLLSAQVKDTSGNFIPAQNLGSFQVSLGTAIEEPTTVPTTPVNFAALASAGAIGLSWSDPAADQSSFLLRRADDSGFTANVQNIPLTISDTSYTDSTAIVGKTYYFQLIAVNSFGPSVPTPTVSATLLPAAPALLTTIFNDGNNSRTTVTALTLVFSQPVTINGTLIGLTARASGVNPPIPITVGLTNPTGDSRTWVLSFSGTGTGTNGTLLDGTYDLNIATSQIVDAYGQNAGADQVRTFTVAIAPTVLLGTFSNSAPPHALSFQFSKDVSASLALSTLKVTNGSSTYTPASFAWNASTLTATWTFAGAFPDNANSYTATLSAATVVDANGVHLDGNRDGISNDNYTFTFKQTKPSLTLSGATPVLVNTLYTLTYGSLSDPGQTVTQYIIHWGDGSTDISTTTGTATHTYLTTATFSATVDVVDANGTHTAAGSRTVQVNRAIVSLAGNNANANVGGTYTFSLGSINDPGQTATGCIVHWGDGSTPGTYATLGAFTHVYTGASAKTITVDLIDGAGTVTNAGTFSLTANAAPTVGLVGNLNTNIGGAYRVVIGTPTDPGYTVTQYLIHWGDGTTTTTSSTGQFGHVYNTTGTQSLTVDITDATGTFSAAGKITVTVNSPPTIVLTGNPTDTQNDIYTLTLGTVTDPGQAVTLYSVHWGDGTVSNYVSGGTATHVFHKSGALNITVDLTDGTGTFAAGGTKVVTVNPSQTIALSGTDANDTFYLKLDANPQMVDLWMNNLTPGVGAPDYQFASLNQLSIAALGGADTFTLDESGGMINVANGITFDAGSGSNTLAVMGTSGADTLSMTATSLTFGTTTISLTNLPSVTYTNGNGDDNITLTGIVPLTLNMGAGNDTLNVAAESTVTVNLGSSNGNLTINGAGNTNLNFGTGGANLTFNTSVAVAAPKVLKPSGTAVHAAGYIKEPAITKIPKKPVVKPKPPVVKPKTPVKKTVVQTTVKKIVSLLKK